MISREDFDRLEKKLDLILSAIEPGRIPTAATPARQHSRKALEERAAAAVIRFRQKQKSGS